MKQVYKAISFVAIGGLAFIVIYAIARMLGIKRGEQNGVVPSVYEDIPVSPIKKPSPETPAIDSESGIVTARAKQLYANKQKRDEVSAKFSVNYPNPGTTQYPAAVRSVLNQSGVDQIPLIPSFISDTYQKKISDFTGAESFESIARTQGYDKAKSVYTELLTFPQFNARLFEAIAKNVFDGNFGTVSARGDHMRLRYWDFDTAMNIFKQLFKQASQGSKELGDALKEQAIEDLRAAGYKIVGYDQ